MRWVHVARHRASPTSGTATSAGTRTPARARADGQSLDANVGGCVGPQWRPPLRSAARSPRIPPAAVAVAQRSWGHGDLQVLGAIRWAGRAATARGAAWTR